MAAIDPQLAELRRHLAVTGGRLVAGVGDGGLALGGAEQAMLVLGPPRSGKTTGIVVPNVLAAPGAVVATSTKPDVLVATLAVRSTLGRCWLFDPSGTVPLPPGVSALRWSPVVASGSWDGALVTARAMVGAARPAGRSGEAAHWTERAEALLSTLLHAAARDGADMRAVVGWVLRQDAGPARAVLEGAGSLAGDVLAGILATDGREQSGIWSSAAGVLAAYRSDAALDAAAAPNFDPTRLAASADTVYVCSPGQHQALTAPVIVGFLESVRAGAYGAAAAAARGEAVRQPPVLLALDELANIAPIPDLPAVLSEGTSQGLTTLGCLQDLSQARGRWGPAADGFLSLFGTKVVLPGIADLATLELVSRLAGEVERPVRSVNRTPLLSRRPHRSESWSLQRQRRLPVDAINQLPSGTALVLSGREAPAAVRLAPWWTLPPFAPLPAAPALPPGRGLGRRRHRELGR